MLAKIRTCVCNLCVSIHAGQDNNIRLYQSIWFSGASMLAAIITFVLQERFLQLGGLTKSCSDSRGSFAQSLKHQD